MNDYPQPLAIIAFTRHGAHLAGRIGSGLPGAEVWIAKRFADEAEGEHKTFEVAPREFVRRIFGRYRGLVFIASVGLVVRLLAAHLRDKTVDPAVVVVDEAGQFAVSVLSGHIGGANRLAERVATVIGARAVITTAAEARRRPAADLIGLQYHWQIENPQALRRLGAALVNDETVGLYQDAGERDWWPDDLPDNVRRFATLDALSAAAPPAAILITDRALPDYLLSGHDGWVLYRPRTLVLGIGCIRGVSEAAISATVETALTSGGVSRLSLREIATIVNKRDEEALVAFAARWGLPLRTFPAQELAQVSNLPHPSEVVRQAVGTPGVAEPAALLAAGARSLLVPKVKGKGVTVAIARLEKEQ